MKEAEGCVRVCMHERERGREKDLKVLLLALKMEEKAMSQAKDYKRFLEAGKRKEVGSPVVSRNSVVDVSPVRHISDLQNCKIINLSF